MTISRALGLALLISFGVHIIVMSAVSIVAYEGPGRTRPYTRVDFLGPILGKTAFEMMLAHASSKAGAVTEKEVWGGEVAALKVRFPGKPGMAQEAPSLQERAMDTEIKVFLAGEKVMPDQRRQPVGAVSPAAQAAGAGRKIVYRPEAPVFMKELYGDKGSFRVKVRVLVNGEGNVTKTEPLTTTGYPQLDIMAAKYLEQWVYEPGRGGAAKDEWLEEEVVLKAGD